MTPEERRYYISHSAESDPGEMSELLASLPKDPTQIVDAVSGLVLDRAFVAPLRVVCPPESDADAQCRPIPAMLARILSRDSAPLATARPPEKRLIGACRHYALLACSALRHHGVPARVRVGFANYFGSGFHDDHWVTEYWEDTRWRLIDPELTLGVRRHYGITFDACDVPRDRFVTAGPAWLGVRSGRIDPATCGVASIGIAGPWFVAGSVVRDLAALNKREMLPWDYWGISRELRPGVPVSAATATRLDDIATLTANLKPHWQSLRDTYEHDAALRVPPVVLSFPGGAPIEVAVPT